MNATMTKDSTNDPQPEHDPIALRNIMGQYATGVAIVTTLGDEGKPVGLAINSFASVSLDPAFVLWSLALKAPSLGAFRSHGSFVINILGEDSKDLAWGFSRPSDDKFAGVDWRAGHDGAPILNEAAAYIECTTESRLEGGDHEIYLGRVQGFDKTDKAPLLFHCGKFAKLGEAL